MCDNRIHEKESMTTQKAEILLKPNKRRITQKQASFQSHTHVNYVA